MQQASVGVCDGGENRTPSSPLSGSPRDIVKKEMLTDRSPNVDDQTSNGGRVRIKLEMPEPTDSVESAKDPSLEDYHHQHQHQNQHQHQHQHHHHHPHSQHHQQTPQPNADFHPTKAKSKDNDFRLAQYRAGPFYPHFYPPPMMPSYPARSMDERCKDDDDSRLEERRFGVQPTCSVADSFLHEHHSRFEDFHKPQAYPGVTYAGFRPSLPRYGNQQNNSAGGYARSNHYQSRQRKWTGAALRGLHPPMPWPAWFFRPDLPIGQPLPTPHGPNSTANVPTSTQLTCRTSQDPPKSLDPPLESSKIHGQTPTICTSIRCTVNGCTCESFTPGKRHLRCCGKCHHGWVTHALARLSSFQQHQQQHQQHSAQSSGGDVSGPRAPGREERSVGGRATTAGGDPHTGKEEEKEENQPASETVEPTAAFDVASLVLYGSRALPIRLKILLDLLLNQLPHAQVTRLLAAFGWTHEDYTRGYILQDSQNGPVLDRWSICSAEEEPLVLQQFLRFAETRPFVQQLLLAAGTPGTDAMSPSRRPSPPTMPLAHLPPPLNLLHCGLPHPLPPPPPPPPVSHPSMSPNQKHYASPATGSPPRSLNSLASPLNRLQSMQPFDFRKLSSIGLPSFAPLPPPPPTDFQRKNMRNLQSPHSHESAASQMRSHMPVAPVSSSLTFGHPLVSSGALPPNFPAHFPQPMGKGGSTMAQDVHSGGEKSSEFGSEEDEDDDENSDSALNLSRRDSMSKHERHHSLSLQAGPLGRPPGIPGRKPHSPGKRPGSQWGASTNMPPNLGTPFINPTTGKKRVQCNVCLKTFCDKGALKIHFSAVHLREMHQCTVKGCSMMFSSRRSRNRHSANPNPKLHSPHLRRKISPHDGRSSMAHALVLPPQVGLPVPPSGLNHLPFGSFPLLTPPPDLRSPASLCGLDFKHLDLSGQGQGRASYEESMHQRMTATTSMATTTVSTLPAATSINSTSTTLNTTTTTNCARGSFAGAPICATSPSPQPPSINPDGDDEDDDDDGGIVVVAEDEASNLSRLPRAGENVDDDDQPADFSLAKRPKLYFDNVDEDLVSNPDSNEDNDSVSGAVDQHAFSVNQHCLNSSSFHSRGVRKRKSQHPTRCAVLSEVHSSSTDGESSNDEDRIKGRRMEMDFQNQPEDMSMSRLEAEERKGSSESFERERSCSPSSNPETNLARRLSAQEHLDNPENLPQDEPRDLSSRASSAKSPKRQLTPSPKTLESDAHSPMKNPQREEEKKSASGAGSAGGGGSAGVGGGSGKDGGSGGGEEADEDDPAEDLDEDDDDDDEEELRNQEGEPPDDPSPSSVDSRPNTVDDLSHDSSINTLRQLESLSQGQERVRGPATTTTTSGRDSTDSPTNTTPITHQEITMDNSSHGSRSSSASPSTAAMDPDSSLITYARYENGGFVSTQEVPLDRDNPRRCTACGKVFQNHFGVKTHYQNVHLKLMHRCSVDGCNAAFPSKRSRDRHSANSNLHRKLLSTSSSPPLSSSLPSSLSPRVDDQMNPLLHNEFLARLYADAGIGALGAYPLTPGLPSGVDLAARIPPPHPLLLPPHLGATFPGLSSFASHLAGLNGLTQQHLNHLSRMQEHRRSNSPMSSPNSDEKKEEARCTVPGCERVFGSRAVRDAHSRDPQAHRDLQILSGSSSGS